MKLFAYSLALLCAAFLLFGCDPAYGKLPAGPTEPNVDTVRFSDGNCDNPEYVVLTDLTSQALDTPEHLNGRCSDEAGRERLVPLPIPKDGNSFVQVYNATSGPVLLSVFHRTVDTKGYQQLTSCLKTEHHFTDLKLDVPNGTLELLLRIEALGNPPKGADISISAYDDALDKKISDYQREADRSIAYSCGSSDDKSRRYLDRLVFSTCDAGVDMQALLKRKGYTIEQEEKFLGGGGVIFASIHPNARGGRTKRTARKDAELNGDNIKVEQDFEFIVPGGQLMQPWQGNDKLGDEIFDSNNGCKGFFGTGSNRGSNGIVVANIDSGVDKNLYSKFFDRYAYTGRGGGRLSPRAIGWNYYDGNGDTHDEPKYGHGTTTAGTIVGGYHGQKVGVEVLHQKVFVAEGDNIKSTNSALVLALHDAIQAGARVINLSLGFEGTEEPFALRCLVEQATSDGIYVITSAGNNDASLDNAPQWPANFGADNYPGFYTVASFANPDASLMAHPPKSDFSNFGDRYVSIAAFETTLAPVKYLGDLGLMEGTSISAPIVSRMIATALGSGFDPVGYLQGRARYSSKLSKTHQVFKGTYIPICGERP